MDAGCEAWQEAALEHIGSGSPETRTIRDRRGRGRKPRPIPNGPDPAAISTPAMERLRRALVDARPCLYLYRTVGGMMPLVDWGLAPDPRDPWTLELADPRLWQGVAESGPVSLAKIPARAGLRPADPALHILPVFDSDRLLGGIALKDAKGERSFRLRCGAGCANPSFARIWRRCWRGPTFVWNAIGFDGSVTPSARRFLTGSLFWTNWVA